MMVAIGLAALTGCGSQPASDGEKTQMRNEVRAMSNGTVQRLYRLQPSARAAITNAAGYAVFSNFGLKIFVAGGGSGKGVAVDNADRSEVFMKMVEVQAGLGLGVKKFQLVWVFENRSDLETFINSGWELGGQATAAAQAGGQGGGLAGAIAIKPGVWLYQMVDDGLALELTVKGTKYFRDTGLI